MKEKNQMFYAYKEIAPKDTILSVRNTLFEIGITVREKLWFHPYMNVYSCALEIEHTDIVSFGKGITAEYCLASAYGELVEEINTGIMFQGMSFSEHVKQELGFLYDPQEIVLHDLEQYQLPSEFEDSFPFRDGTSTEKFFSTYIKKYLRNGLVVEPFCDLLTGRKCNLPISIVSLINGSNGICAGNTKEEALIHGLCEILERYSVKQHFLHQLPAPEFSKESIKEQAPEIFQMVQEIERNGDYHVIIKDCSIGKRFPVVAIVLIDDEQNRYAVNFGADPDLSIALHRCITEVYQGGEIPEHKLNEINFENAGVDIEECNKFIRSGRGKWPTSFFVDEGEVPFVVKTYSDIFVKFQDVLNIFEQNGARGIWIRDCSYIALNSFQVIVPGFSEALSLPNEYKCIREIDESIEYMTNLQNLNSEKLNDFAQSLEWHIKYRFSGARKFIQDYINIQFDDDLWDSITIECLLFIIYLKLGNTARAMMWLQTYISVLSLNECDDDALKFFLCILDAFKIAEYEKDRDEIEEILLIYYSSEIVKDALSVINNPSNLFDSLEELPCFDCSVCKNIQTCNYRYKEALYKKIKQRKRDVNV